MVILSGARRIQASNEQVVCYSLQSLIFFKNFNNIKIAGLFMIKLSNVKKHLTLHLLNKSPLHLFAIPRLIVILRSKGKIAQPTASRTFLGGLT